MQNTNLFVTDPDIERCRSQWPDLKAVYAGCKLLAGLDLQGNFHYHSTAYTYYRSKYWDNLVMMAPDKDHTGVLFGLKTDGTCVVSKDPFAGYESYSPAYNSTRLGNDGFSSLLKKIHSVENIIQIAVSGSLFLALDRQGKVHPRRYLWENSFDRWGRDSVQFQIEAIESWENIRRILLAERDIVIAQKNSGELVTAGYTNDLYGTFGETAFRCLQDYELIDACSFCGGESFYYVFLDADGTLHNNRRPEKQRFRQVVGLDHAFLGLRTDGKIISFQGTLEESVRNWPHMKQISIGRRSFDRYDDLFLAGLCDDETEKTIRQNKAPVSGRTEWKKSEPDVKKQAHINANRPHQV